MINISCLNSKLFYKYNLEFLDCHSSVSLTGYKINIPKVIYCINNNKICQQRGKILLQIVLKWSNKIQNVFFLFFKQSLTLFQRKRATWTSMDPSLLYIALYAERFTLVKITVQLQDWGKRYHYIFISMFSRIYILIAMEAGEGMRGCIVLWVRSTLPECLFPRDNIECLNTQLRATFSSLRGKGTSFFWEPL